jgi:hypothetical protein
MAGAKLVVLYPCPQDVDVFERVYTEEHVPMVNENTMKGIKPVIGPERNRAVFIRKIECLIQFFPPGQFQRYLASQA